MSPDAPTPKYGGEASHLYPYLQRRVRTPKGDGTLIQVFSDEVVVRFNDEAPVGRFRPDRVTPLEQDPIDEELRR